MLEKMNLLGAVVAHVVFLSSIIVFVMRLASRVGAGHWAGVPFLLMVFPLGYLLLKAPELERPFLYYVQVSLMLAWIVALCLLDYVFKVEFRQTRWAVICFVVSYFAAIGGMIGVAAEAGRGWAISAVILFFITATLAFAQRAATGI